VFVNGCLTVFFDVAYTSYLPSIIERDQLVDGNSKLELTRTSSQRLGPGAAGILIGLFQAPFAIVLDALSYLWSAAFVLWIRREEPAIEPHDEASGPRPSMRADIAVGLRYVGGHRWLRALALSVAASYLFGQIADSILILYLVTERGFSAALVGFAFTIGSVGVIGGALAAGRVTKALGVGPTLLVASFGGGLSWLPVAAAPDALLFPGLALTIVSLGFFGVLWNINSTSLRQAITPKAMLGRTNATMRFISWGAIPAGSILGGYLGGVIGLHPTIWVGAIGALLIFVPVALSSVRHLREMPTAPDESPG
jgi:hypothetical protein